MSASPSTGFPPYIPRTEPLPATRSAGTGAVPIRRQIFIPRDVTGSSSMTHSIWRPIEPPLGHPLGEQLLQISSLSRRALGTSDIQSPSPAAASIDQSQSKIAPESTEVIVASGPGGRAWGQQLIEKMEHSLQRDKAIASFTVLGDGQRDLSTESIIEAIKIAKAKKLAISLFIQTHGETIGTDLELYFSDRGTSARMLFQEIKEALGDEYPLFIFTTACHGGTAAQIAADKLPKGTVFVALTQKDSLVTAPDVEKFVNQMNSSPCWYSSEKMLYAYLMTLQNRNTPVVTCAPHEPWNLELILRDQRKEPLSESQTAEICRSLSDWMEPSEILSFIKKIEKASSTNDFTASEWGKALAVSFSIFKTRV